MRYRLVAVLCFLAVIPRAVAEDSRISAKEWVIDGVGRTALIYVPASATKAETPIVFVFHGHGGNMRHSAEKFAIHKNWPEAIAVYMQGLPTPGRFDPEGKSPGWQKKAGEQGDRDLKFFDEVLASLKKEYKVDDKRVYITGHSNGAGFTYLLWAVRGEVFAAVAPSAGGPGRNFRALTPLPAMHIAGENDSTVPFAGQQRVMEAVRRLNGCDVEGSPWAQAGTLVGTQYASKSGRPFVSVIYPGTHKFPDEAGALIAKFFREHSKH